MTDVKKADFTKETNEGLAQTLAEKREALRVFRFNVTGSARRDARSQRTTRKDVARILTELNRRRREETRGVSARPREGFLEQSEQKSPRGVQHRYGAAY